MKLVLMKRKRNEDHLWGLSELLDYNPYHFNQKEF